MKIDVNEKSFYGIMNYCYCRNLNCNNCPFSIKKYVDSETDVGYSTCIFENCPRDWSAYYGDD